MATDCGSGSEPRSGLNVRVETAAGRLVRRINLSAGERGRLVRVGLGSLAPGRYRLRLTAVAAGDPRVQLLHQFRVAR